MAKSHQLVVQLAGDFFASVDELQTFEDRLRSYLPKTHDLVNHAFDSGTVNLLIETDSPVTVYKIVFRVSTRATQRRMRIAYRTLRGAKFTNLWPRRDPRPFAYGYAPEDDPFAPVSKQKIPKRSPRGTRAI